MMTDPILVLFLVSLIEIIIFENIIMIVYVFTKSFICQIIDEYHNPDKYEDWI